MLRQRIFPLLKSAKVHHAARIADPIQEESLKENCLLVDNNDKVIGSATKRDCHRVTKGGNILLHRAFSVFLFDTREELLLQKRSPTKITFPGCFTNTCCSHPLFDIEEELVEEGALGIKLAAIRRLHHELGIPKKELSPDDFKYVTRIIYKSLGDNIWGEHEIDYVLLIKKDVSIKPNPEEVSEIRFVSKHAFSDFINNLNEPVTPWFKLIANSKLRLWWDNLDSLEKFMDHKNIHSFS
uniref:isopentenyl-diphosphate Delta-isomerase n=1 Tax=Riptortus pedestris TaxID=329032 RepID=R4WQC4_RIPPE|nr:isopentenyl-diphosphate delta isomerase [Riptortus pedestris]